MAESLRKFPSTPHLLWLGAPGLRNDKVFTPAEAQSFLSEPVVVEEKIDGANLGISIDDRGRLRFQNRGNFLPEKLTGQWERLRAWAFEHDSALRNILRPDRILFGEWCYATHSIQYHRLPDWFLAFDFLDLTTASFWSAARRDSLLAASDLVTVPRVATGRFTSAELIELLDGPSACSDGAREGLYLRREENGRLLQRAKLVRPDFTQSIEEHWMKRPMTRNRRSHPSLL